MNTLTKGIRLLGGIILLIGIISVVFYGYKDPEGEKLPTYSPTSGWQRAEPNEVGLKGDILANMVSEIRASSTQTRSSLVVKDGYLVVEEYYRGYNEGDKQQLYSCTKSVVSTLIGIAIMEDKIESVDEKLEHLLPTENMDQWMKNITLENLLMMSAGFPGDDWLYDFKPLNEMLASPDPLKYMLTREQVFEPGSRFEYTDGVSHILSCIIREKTGTSAAKYAEEKLFNPLGITEYSWDSDAQGRNWGYAELTLSARDMAKIGLLFLNEGVWDGKQIIPKSYVRDATRHRINANLLDGYGYQWWVEDDGWYTALGYKGQFIMVFPELNIVAVFTGGTPDTYNYNIQLANRFIIRAAGK